MIATFDDAWCKVSKRIRFSISLDADLHKKVSSSAKEAGRGLTKEIELRLSASYEDKKAAEEEFERRVREIVRDEVGKG